MGSTNISESVEITQQQSAPRTHNPYQPVLSRPIWEVELNELSRGFGARRLMAVPRSPVEQMEEHMARIPLNEPVRLCMKMIPRAWLEDVPPQSTRESCVFLQDIFFKVGLSDETPQVVAVERVKRRNGDFCNYTCVASVWFRSVWHLKLTKDVLHKRIWFHEGGISHFSTAQALVVDQGIEDRLRNKKMVSREQRHERTNGFPHRPLVVELQTRRQGGAEDEHNKWINDIFRYFGVKFNEDYK